MNSEVDPDRIARIAAFTESAGKVIVGITGLSLLCGIIITNLYLLKWGIVDFSIVKTKFVITGAVFMIVHGFLYLIFIAFVHPLCRLLQSRRKLTRKRVITDLSLSLILAVGNLMVAWILAVALFNKNYSPFSELIVIDWRSLWPFLLLYPTIMLSYASYATRLRTLIPRLATIFILSVAWLANLTLFAGEIYPKVNPQFGGGRPLKATFLLRDDFVRNLPPRIGPNSGMFLAEWALLHERSEEYIVAALDSSSRHLKIITIPKAQTLGFLLDEEHPYERTVEDVRSGAVYSASPSVWDTIIRLNDADFSLSDIGRLTSLTEFDVSTVLALERQLQEAKAAGADLFVEGQRLVQANGSWKGLVDHFLVRLLTEDISTDSLRK